MGEESYHNRPPLGVCDRIGGIVKASGKIYKGVNEKNR